MSSNAEIADYLRRTSSKFYCNSSSSTTDSTHIIIFPAYGYKKPEYNGLRYASDRNCPNSVGLNNNTFSFGYSIGFFINERKNHYTNLDRVVFSPLWHLSMQIQHAVRFETLRLGLSLPTSSIHYDNAQLHMLKNAPNLPNQIRQFSSDLITYNNDIHLFSESINQTIREAFRKPSDALVIRYYEYNVANVRDTAISAWNEIIDPNINELLITQARLDNYLSDVQKYAVDINRDSGILRVNALNIADGLYDDLQNIVAILSNNIIKNNTLFATLLSLVQRRTTLVGIANDIGSASQEISDMIQNESYTTKAKCCPTLWGLIEKYIL
jgi:hypothetical protein